MTIVIEKNFLSTDENKAFDSVNELILSSGLSGKIELKSYYDGWQNTVAGPQGGLWVHTTGATNTAPTIGSPVPVSTIGAGAQLGYFWDAEGVEWKISDQAATLEQAGVMANGIDDCQPAIEDYRQLIELSPGTVNIDSTVTITQSRFYQGTMPPGTTPQGAGSTQTYVNHTFDGIAFNFTGTNNDLEGAGGGLKNISIIQTHGDGSTESGTAIQAIATATVRPNWLKFENLNIEETSGANSWDYGLRIDGSAHADLIRNIWIDRCRFVAGTFASRAMSLIGVANAFVNGCQGNLANADLEIGGGSASVFINNSTFADLVTDNAAAVYVTGGSYQNITTTSNTTNAVFLTAVSNGAPVLAGSRNFYNGLDIANSRYLFSSSGEPFVFRVPGGNTEFEGTQTVVNATQVLVEGRYNGYGAGVQAVSRTSDGGSRVVMGRITWQGTAAWDTTAANQDAKAVISATTDGTETDCVEVSTPASINETGLLVLHDGSIKRVAVGATDSAGTGFRMLRIVN